MFVLSQNDAKNSFAPFTIDKNTLLPALLPEKQARNSIAPLEAHQQRHFTAHPVPRNARESQYYRP
jgi:hypothetical protein